MVNTCKNRVRIITLHFANSSYCDCEVVNYTKIAKQFFPKENSIRPNYIGPYYILILFIHYILLSKEILLLTKITPQNIKNASQFLKNISTCGEVKALLRSAYL